MSEKTNINAKPTLTETEIIACCICLDEIPESVAASSEGDAYTQHFCGIECYTLWRKPTQNKN